MHTNSQLQKYQDFYIYPKLFIPILLTNSVQPNINSEFAVLLMNDQIQQYLISDAKRYGFVKLFMLQIVQRDHRPSKSRSSDPLFWLCKHHSSYLILRFFHTEHSMSRLITSLKMQWSSSRSIVLGGTPLLLKSTA